MYGRFLKIYGRFPKPEQLLATHDAKLRAAGLSARKIEHMKDLSARVSDSGDVSHILPWQAGHPARRRLGTTQGHPKGVFSFRASVAGSHPQHCQGVEAILQRRHMVSVEVARAVQGNRIG